MARDDENKVLNDVRSPEDAEGHKVALKYVFNPEKKKFYPESGDLYSAEPQKYRENVTSVDNEDPPVSAGINCEGFKRCVFDIIVQGVNITSLKVRLLKWNTKANCWFPSGPSVKLNDYEGFLASGGKVSLIEDEAFGATVFLKVSEFIGDVFNMNVYRILC